MLVPVQFISSRNGLPLSTALSISVSRARDTETPSVTSAAAARAHHPGVQIPRLEQLEEGDSRIEFRRPLRGFDLFALRLHPSARPAVWRALSAYRKAQEALRGRDKADSAQQLRIAAAQVGMTQDRVAAIVDEWMIERPLKYLARWRAHGLADLLDFLKACHVRLGVLSDYPAQKKLDALGVGHYFSIVLCGGDPNVGAFKPHPRGFLAACETWQLAPADVLYVGDRIDADAAGARAAKMPAVIVTDATLPADQGALAVPSLERLRHVLDDNHSR